MLHPKNQNRIEQQAPLMNNHTGRQTRYYQGQVIYRMRWFKFISGRQD
jgi:hypothetical protein